MKTKGIITVLCIVLFSSCIVKSIKPFYINEHVKFDKRLVGKWSSGKSNTWEIVSLKEELKKEENKKTSDDVLKLFEHYKEGYIIEQLDNENKASFLAMPFMVKEKLFLDFTPFDYDTKTINNLAVQHILNTHSVANVEFLNNGNIKLKWIDESVVKKLINDHKMRIKHEVSNFDEDLILTANSEELYHFLERFIDADIENKWDKDVIKTLKPNHAKP